MNEVAGHSNLNGQPSTTDSPKSLQPSASTGLIADMDKTTVQRIAQTKRLVRGNLPPSQAPREPSSFQAALSPEDLMCQSLMASSPSKRWRQGRVSVAPRGQNVVRPCLRLALGCNRLILDARGSNLSAMSVQISASFTELTSDCCCGKP